MELTVRGSKSKNETEGKIKENLLTLRAASLLCRFINPKLVERSSCGSTNCRACLMPQLTSSEHPPQVHLLCFLRWMWSQVHMVSSPLVQYRVMVHANDAEFMALRYAVSRFPEFEIDQKLLSSLNVYLQFQWLAPFSSKFPQKMSDPRRTEQFHLLF